MKWVNRAGMSAMVAAAGLLLGGCAGSYQARDAEVQKAMDDVLNALRSKHSAVQR